MWCKTRLKYTRDTGTRETRYVAQTLGKSRVVGVVLFCSFFGFCFWWICVWLLVRGRGMNAMSLLFLSPSSVFFGVDCSVLFLFFSSSSPLLCTTVRSILQLQLQKQQMKHMIYNTSRIKCGYRKWKMKTKKRYTENNKENRFSLFFLFFVSRFFFFLPSLYYVRSSFFSMVFSVLFFCVSFSPLFGYKYDLITNNMYCILKDRTLNQEVKKKPKTRNRKITEKPENGRVVA